MSDAPYDVSIQKTHSIVTLRPRLSEAEWGVIESAGDDIVEQISQVKQTDVIVDLTPLTFMGSSTVTMLIRCWKTVQAQDRGFAVVTNSVVVREVLELSGLAKMWTIVPTIDVALKKLGVRTTSAGPAGWLGTVSGVIALVVALIGVGLWMTTPARRELATMLIYGGAAVGLIVGLVITIVADSPKRLAGLGLILFSVGTGVFRLMQ